MSEELKPCPFCGNTPIDEPGYGIYCWNCDVDEAGAWNTRPIEDALRARIAELELRLDAYNGNLLDVLQAENERLNKRAEYLEEQTRKACHLATTERADELAQSYLAYWDDIHTERAELRDACKHALMFIVNGIACGRIELPDPALGDKANDTEELLRSVLERYSL